MVGCRRFGWLLAGFSGRVGGRCWLRGLRFGVRTGGGAAGINVDGLCGRRGVFLTLVIVEGGVGVGEILLVGLVSVVLGLEF